MPFCILQINIICSYDGPMMNFSFPYGQKIYSFSYGQKIYLFPYGQLLLSQMTLWLIFPV